jgi:alcohol dehydrogenase YqhD (iron-dependent ADH family)
MDAAKCIAMLAVNDGLIWDYAYKGVHQPMQRFQKALPLICIPTVAATSSESDSYAVVTHEATREKCTVFGDAFQPFLSIVDPVLTYSVPPKATVDGAIDIIVHVLEEYLSSREEAPLQDRFSLAIAQTVMDALPRVLKNLRDTEARTQLSWCSTIALSGFLSGREGGWPLHAMEHVLSAHYDISHGSGLAALLIPMMKFDLPVLSQKSNPLSIDGMADWMKSVGANYTLTQLGISNADFPRLADDVIRLNGDSRGILENSIPMGKSEILQVLREAT